MAKLITVITSWRDIEMRNVEKVVVLLVVFARLLVRFDPEFIQWAMHYEESWLKTTDLVDVLKEVVLLLIACQRNRVDSIENLTCRKLHLELFFASSFFEWKCPETSLVNGKVAYDTFTWWMIVRELTDKVCIEWLIPIWPCYASIYLSLRWLENQFKTSFTSVFTLLSLELDWYKR